MKYLRSLLPEFALTAAAVFFFYRELGTFPRSWVDEGLFIMVAKMVAGGHGYGIPLLDHVWRYPYFLAVGPTIILPAALSIKLFGLSVAAARLPMTLYLLATCVVTYVFTQRAANTSTARWATALLISLSAFVNTGKPVLGEVPAFFFLLIGFFLMTMEAKPWKRGMGSGIFFGLSILTKLTYGLILPALGIAWISAAIRRQWQEVWSLTLSACVALIIYLPWRVLEALHTPAGSLTQEIGKSIFGTGGLPLLNVLRNNNGILLQLPFLAFSAITILGLLGLWSAHTRLTLEIKTTITTVAGLFLLYFLDSFGWYRHLLPAHLLLIPFVPAGISRLLSMPPLSPPKRGEGGASRAGRGWRRSAVPATLTIIIAAQALWQLDHRGSGVGTALAETVQMVEERYRDTDLLIENAEVLAQLPENPHWVYLIPADISPSMPALFLTPSKTERCFARLKAISGEERQQYGKRATILAGNYALLAPPSDCAK